MSAMAESSGAETIGPAAGSDPILVALDMEIITGWNERAESLLGWTESDVWRKNVGDLLIAPTERVAYASWARRGRAEGLDCPFQEFTALHRDGRQFPALFKLLARTSSEQGVHCHLSLRALCGQIHSRDEPSSPVEPIRSLLETLPVGVFIADQTGSLIQSNAEAHRIWGGLRCVGIPQYDEYKGWWPTGEALQAEDWAMARALNRGETSLNELITIESFDGVRRTILNSAMPIRDANQKIVGGVAVNQDVTELTRIQDELRRSHEELDARVARRTEEVSRTATGRKIAEEKLRRQQSLLQYIIDFLPHFIFWKDREARLLGGNKMFLTQALGVNSVEEMIGKTDYDYFPKEQADYFRKCDFAVMESGEAMLDIEESQRQSGKGERTLLTSKVPLRDENGAIIGLLGSYADITERKRTERELEEAKKAAEAAAEAKSEFLATISHELRTPLTLILGPLETILCRGGAELPGDVREQLERIKRNASRLYVLVNDILDFTKAEAGKMQVTWEQVDAGALASEIVSDAEPAAQNKSIQLHFSQDPDLGHVPLDRGKFEKILLNLLGNALKFTPVGGRIDVTVRSLGDDFELSVADSGLGIAPEQQKLLFQKFQQLDSSATRKYEGTGIGLALVKEFAGLMGGSVGVSSEPGRGSRFFVRFARTADRAMTAQLDQARDSTPPPAGAGGVLFEHRLISRQMYPRSERDAGPAGPRASTSGPRVLVVEDNPDMRAYVSEILADEYRVEPVENGVQALAAARARPPDIIVSDIMMPEMDGLELVSRLKNIQELRSIPVVLLTAKASSEGIVTGLDVGADDYLCKPFAPAELKARVRTARRLHQAQLDLEAALKSVRDTQEQLIHAAKMAAMGTLIAGLSHELNNPLGAILMSVQALMRVASPDAAFTKGILATIERQTRRCTHLVRALLDFSRKQPSQREAISPAELFDRVEELSAPIARGRGVCLSFERCELGRPGAALVVCLQELETALLNLLNNAIAATPAQGQVWLRAKELRQLERDGIQISVIDTGKGISDDVLPHIFDPFFTTKPPGEGTGLGLSLTRRIIDSHGGTIHVTSKHGEGTSVEVWLPVEITPSSQ